MDAREKSELAWLILSAQGPFLIGPGCRTGLLLSSFSSARTAVEGGPPTTPRTKSAAALFLTQCLLENRADTAKKRETRDTFQIQFNLIMIKEYNTLILSFKIGRARFSFHSSDVKKPLQLID